MPAPLLSIVIPCYNTQEFLREALCSALGQTWPAVEVIAVDDCSTDNTPDILRDYERRENFRWVRHERNMGLTKTRNTGYRLVRGQYFLWLDSDDYIAPDFAATLMQEAVQHPGAIIAGPWRKVRLLGGEWKADAELMSNTSADDVLRLTLRGGWPLHCMACVFPREVMESVGVWDEAMPTHEDRLLLSQLLIRKFPLRFVQESCAFYRIRHSSNATHRTEAAARAALRLAGIIERELAEAGRLGEFANDFAHFLDLYYIDSLPDFPAVAAEFAALRDRVCPQYCDLRGLHSRVARAVIGDYWFARLARAMGIDRKR